MKRLAVVAALLCLIFFVAEMKPGRCEPVKGYSSYVSLLPGGKEKQDANFALIERAKEEVRTLEIGKKKRDVKFDKPLDIHYLNSRYTMVGFQVFFRPIENSRFSTTPSIVGLLFEGSGKDGLTGYTSSYVRWIGKTEIADYKAASIRELCASFRREGVEDCVPDQAGKVAKTRDSAGDDRISGDQIVGGRVKAEYIDNAIARRRDVDRAIEASLGRVEQLRGEIREQKDGLRSMSQVLQTMEMKLKGQPEKELEMARQQSLRETALVERIKKIEESLAKQTEAAKNLDGKVDKLAALLEGISRNKNNIIITGANLQIVNGTGTTLGEENGTGNLIVGYNEKKPGESLLLGSHDIIYPRPETESSVSSTEKGLPPASIPEDQGFFSGKCFIGSLFD